MGGQNFVTMGPVPDSQNDQIVRSQIGGAGGAALSNVANAAATTIIPAVTGKRIYVHAMQLAQSNNNNAFTLLDVSAAGATISVQSGAIEINAGIPLVLPYCQYPWFTCAPGDSLCYSSIFGTVLIGGSVLYVQG